MIDALQTASSGMANAAQRFGTAAQAVARAFAPTGGAAPVPADQVDLSGTALGLIGAEAAFALNAAVFRTADRMERRLLDISV